MIFGYISRKEHPETEYLLHDIYSNGKSYRFSSESGKAYFFIDSNNFCHQPLWEDTSSLIICNGIPINGSPEKGYNIVEMLPERIVRERVGPILNDIVSNVNLCIFTKNNGQMKLFLSSDRASAYRFFYRFVNSSLFFSTNYSILMRIAKCKMNEKSIYSIIKYNAPPTPLTIIEDIFVVPPSYYLEFNLPNAQPKIAPYFQFKFEGKEKSNLGRVEKILESTASILSKMNSTMLLSGGVDSTLLACKMRDQSNNNGLAYFISYGKDDDELKYAKEAAIASNYRLNTFNMEERELYDTIKEIGKLSSQPFNDDSFIPTYYLMKQINKNNNERIIVDCTGADGCFGDYLLYVKNRWKNAYMLPSVIKRVLSYIYSNTDIWLNTDKVGAIFSFISTLNDRELSICPYISTPNNRIFLRNIKYDTEVDHFLMELVHNLNVGTGNNIFEENVTILHLAHTCGSVSSHKAYLMDDLTNLKTIYPYLWKDMLEEQGNLSWSLKVKDGIIKYPLKKMLENYMPHSFIYRRKTGFTPEFSKAYESVPVYKLLTEVDLPKFNNLIDRSRYDKCLKYISNRQKPNMEQSYPLNNFIWSLIYTDQWIKYHPVDCN